MSLEIEIDTLSAPIIYFEGVTNQGANGGIFNIALAVQTHHAQDDGTVVRRLKRVADLRATSAALLSLKVAIDNALLLGAAPVSTDQAN